ncbi:hypothetical protein ZIOFF_026698 [Zingiber officinale]|uniref:OTU domain-containing protein n=1 Tax=Zingiber officinale TaxID=94328 RepID=A0A8J5LKP0_ZINOF|nr:hypothetical protein ZIOFF_026698 [Zingiber officinale]
MESFISGTGLNAGTWTKEGDRSEAIVSRRLLISLPYQSASSASVWFLDILLLFRSFLFPYNFLGFWLAPSFVLGRTSSFSRSTIHVSLLLTQVRFSFQEKLHMAHIFQNQAGPSTNILSCHENDTKDDRTIALILSEEYANLDNEIARRLSNLPSVPHVPRVNTFFPSFSDASLDHQRLLQRVQLALKLHSVPVLLDLTLTIVFCARLNAYGLYEVRVSGDGNCQVSSWYIFKVNTYDLGRLNGPTDILYISKFRALSDQLYRSSEYHKHVRKEIVKQLKEFPLYYEGYVPMKYKRYYKKMAKSGEWGDHVTLQAAADKMLLITIILLIYVQFQAKICLLTSFRDMCFVEIVPQNQAPQRELWLSFWSEVHYNSIYQLRDLPLQRRPKKKHWLF